MLVDDADFQRDTYSTCDPPSPPNFTDGLFAAGAWRTLWLLPRQRWIAAPITASTSHLSVFVWAPCLASWLSAALEVQPVATVAA